MSELIGRGRGNDRFRRHLAHGRDHPLIFVDEDVALAVEGPGEGVVDNVDANDPLGGGDATPSRDQQPHRAAVGGWKRFAVHLPDQHDVGVGGDVEGKPALHLREVATLGDDIDGALLDAGHVQHLDQGDAGPLRVADGAVLPLGSLDLGGIVVEAAPAVAGALEEGGDRPRLHPLQIVERQVQLLVDEAGHGQPPLLDRDVDRDRAVGADKEEIVRGEEVIRDQRHRGLEGGRAALDHFRTLAQAGKQLLGGWRRLGCCILGER